MAIRRQRPRLTKGLLIALEELSTVAALRQVPLECSPDALFEGAIEVVGKKVDEFAAGHWRKEIGRSSKIGAATSLGALALRELGCSITWIGYSNFALPFALALRRCSAPAMT